MILDTEQAVGHLVGCPKNQLHVSGNVQNYCYSVRLYNFTVLHIIILCLYLLYTVDTVTLDESGYSGKEGNEVVTITVTRSGDLLNDITIPFRARAVPDAVNAAIRKT